MLWTWSDVALHNIRLFARGFTCIFLSFRRYFFFLFCIFDIFLSSYFWLFLPGLPFFEFIDFFRLGPNIAEWVIISRHFLLRLRLIVALIILVLVIILRYFVEVYLLPVFFGIITPAPWRFPLGLFFRHLYYNKNIFKLSKY